MSNDKVKIGERWVGDGEPCYVIAEIGINHNGDPKILHELIDVAASAGADAVKLQKRTLEVVYTPEELAKARPTPFGETNGDLKRHLELSVDAFHGIDRACRDHGIHWFASCWDEASIEVMEQLDPPAYKVASASLTDHALLRAKRATGKPILLSTGMSTLEEIDAAVEVLGTDDLVILHCTSTYPSKDEELNLRAIPVLRERYGVPIGYSGHELGLATSVAAVALGACMVERHITLDRSMFGSDQAASIEPQGFTRLVRDIRTVERALGDGQKRLYPSEVPIMKKLRRVGLRMPTEE
ncbi:MAG: N-acetylneuraminate synthase family protein [Myxococcales bacterium]|nr:N-acetylneuraminate synthase family protein [Myxococcales bacterium]